MRQMRSRLIEERERVEALQASDAASRQKEHCPLARIDSVENMARWRPLRVSLEPSVDSTDGDF